MQPTKHLQFLWRAIIIPNLVKCAGFKPDCAPIADEMKGIEPVNSIGEILSLSRLVPGDSQIIAALGTALIAAEKSTVNRSLL